MSDMVCTYAGNRDETIVAYLYGDIPPSDRFAFESHLTTCATCRDELNELGAVRSQLSRWAPPERQTTVRVPAASASASFGSAGPPRKWWDEVPAWAQVAAAMLVLGATAGVANVNVHVGHEGFSVQTGWMRPPTVRSETAAAPAASQAPWRADLMSFEQQLRTELHPANVAVTTPDAATAVNNDAELLRKVRALISESEKREQTELALRIGQVSHDVQTQRIADMSNIDRNLGLIQSNTGIAVAQQRQYINSLVRVSSQTQAR